MDQATEQFDEEAGFETKDVASLQMLLTNSSFGHEYARKEFESAKSFGDKEELLEKMHYFKEVYFKARKALDENFPEVLDHIEQDIVSQKQAVFTTYNA
ncbi:MAG: hypothetical protein Q7S00_04695 [bacterium]|nr:hypothetical protein [bacterium]